MTSYTIVYTGNIIKKDGLLVLMWKTQRHLYRVIFVDLFFKKTTLIFSIQFLDEDKRREGR